MSDYKPVAHRSATQLNRSLQSTDDNSLVGLECPVLFFCVVSSESADPSSRSCSSAQFLDGRLLEEYQIGEQLGSGGFGFVCRAKCRADGSYAVVRRF